MMKKINATLNSVLFAGCLAVLIFGITACQQETEQEEVKTIKLAYANWSEGVAMTHLAAEILEEKLGYEAITKMTDIESVFELLNSGEYDVFVDTWLPDTHGDYMDQYGADLEDLGVNIEKVRTGLVVPDYVNIRSISELEGNVEHIIGIGSGAGIMNATEKAIEMYNLSLGLEEGSERSMTDALIDAIKKRETIVVTGWTPHWIYNRYDLRFLEDPKNVYGDSEKIHTIARKGFTTEHSRASLFFERFELSEEQLGALMNEITALPDNERRAVRNWIRDNEFVVNRWIRGLQPEREKVM